MPPNILLLLSDEHAQWALGCYGNREIRTPNLDTLAASGAMMMNAFAVSPVCSPSRATLLTGRLPSQHGIHDWLFETDPYIGNRNWLAAETTLAQLLAGRGDYHVGLAGKWHCGRSHLPQPGFDYWFSTHRAQTPHRGKHAYRFWDRDMALSGFSTRIITQRAMDFLRQRPRSTPFFLLAGYTGPHSPWRDHPVRWTRAYEAATFGDLPQDRDYPYGEPAGEALTVPASETRAARIQYYAAVSHLDEQVGILLDELDFQGALANTLIVYTSDHGLNCGHHGLWGKGNATRPQNMLDESLRVPLLLHYPAAIPQGMRQPEFVDHTDLFQTLLEFAGVRMEPGLLRQRNYPGRSFGALLAEKSSADWRTDQYGEYGNMRMIRTRTHKLVRTYPGGAARLFDLQVDPRETTDLASLPWYTDLVAELGGRLQAYFDAYQDSARSGLNVSRLPRYNHAEPWHTADEAMQRRFE